MTDQKVTVRVPSIQHPAEGRTDASYYRGAADKLRRGYEAGGSGVRNAIADLLDRVADQLNPELTEPAMTDQERAYYTAARDLQGNARLRSGRGLIVADKKHTLTEVRWWEQNAELAVPGRIERAEEQPWHWVWQYRAVRELLEHEQGEVQP
ncbi:hypothetical protein HJ581_0008305 [Rhodococcus opacus]|nr:hypothetical protein HJ581_0008305 [Rhodococcus opacus]